MDRRIPRPSSALPVDKNKSNLLTCVDNLVWTAPTSLPKDIRIKQAIYHGSQIYAIDENGKLVYGTAESINFFKEKTLIQLDYLHVELPYFITETEVFRANSVSPFFKAKEGEHIRELKCGSQHGFIITNCAIYAFGNSAYGQRMKIDNAMSEIPNVVPELYVTDTLFTGGWNNYILRDGVFYGWGYNQDGRLGNNGNQHLTTPTKLDFHQLGIYTLACGGWHTLGLTRSGNVYAWGLNLEHSIPGANSHETFRTPTLLWDKGNVLNVFSGGYASSSFLQLVNGDMYGFGKNSGNAFFGPQIDNGDSGFVKTPTIIPALKDVAVRHFCMTYTGCVLVLDTRVQEFNVKRVEKFVDIWINCCI